MNCTDKLISHNNETTLNLDSHRNRIACNTNLTLSLNDTLRLLDEIVEFELGRFLLMNKGLNGYWTSYIILLAVQHELTHPLEHWLIHNCPGILATQERFKIFNQQLTNCLRNDISIASIPCGLMDDLLLLNDDFTNISRVGIDLDENSLNLAAASAYNKKKEKSSSFLHMNAWHLHAHESYDVITSNGLNIYESNQDKVTELYRIFFNALKTNAVLITSFLTPPPSLSNESTWKNINPDNLLKQKAIFNDILQVGWQSYQTEGDVRNKLSKVGFTSIDIIYDSQGMFPTVVARKL